MDGNLFKKVEENAYFDEDGKPADGAGAANSRALVSAHAALGRLAASPSLAAGRYMGAYAGAGQMVPYARAGAMTTMAPGLYGGVTPAEISPWYSSLLGGSNAVDYSTHPTEEGTEQTGPEPDGLEDVGTENTAQLAVLQYAGLQ